MAWPKIIAKCRIPDQGVQLYNGFVAQSSHRSNLPKPQTDLSHLDRLLRAQCCAAIQNRSTDLKLRHLPVKVPRLHTVCQSFETVHLRFDQAAAMIATPLFHSVRPRYFTECSCRIPDDCIDKKHFGCVERGRRVV